MKKIRNKKDVSNTVILDRAMEFVFEEYGLNKNYSLVAFKSKPGKKLELTVSNGEVECTFNIVDEMLLEELTYYNPQQYEQNLDS